MADDVEAKVVTAPAAAATAPAATVTDYALLAASAPVMAVAVLTTPHSHVQRARALWLVLAASRPEARLHTVLLGDLATFAHSGRSTNPGFQQLADDPEPGFFAWTNSGREVLVSPRLFDFADGVEGVRAAFVNALVLRLLAHEAEHVRQFRDTGSPPTSYRMMGDFEVKAYSATRDQIAQLPPSGKAEEELLEAWSVGLDDTIAAAAKARDAKTEAEALGVFTEHNLLPPDAALPPRTLYVPTP